VSKIFTPPGGRIDTLGFSFPVEPGFERRGAVAQVVGLSTPGEAWTYRHRLAGGGVIGLGIAGKGWVEASMPKRATNGVSNVEGLPVASALEVAREAWGEAQAFCTARCRFEDSRVVRLDAIRDFGGVAQLSSLLDGLANLPRGGRDEVRRYQDGERGRAETLRVGPRAWGATLYDKAAESPGLAPSGSLRFEARLHSDQLSSAAVKKLGVGLIRHLADVRTENVAAIGHAWFGRALFDREVVGMGRCADLVFTAPGVSERERAGLWAYLTAPAFASRLSRPTRYKYHKLAATLGVAPSAALAEATGECPVRVRLDWDAGSEVWRAV
jgi:hypothetical protein